MLLMLGSIAARQCAKQRFGELPFILLQEGLPARLGSASSSWVFRQAPMRTARCLAACSLQDDAEFHSAKSVLAEMGGEIAKSLELASFHTVSKGALGECGLRGGYVELTNMHPKTVEELYKVASINLAPNSYGQVSCKEPDDVLPLWGQHPW